MGCLLPLYIAFYITSRITAWGLKLEVIYRTTGTTVNGNNNGIKDKLNESI